MSAFLGYNLYATLHCVKDFFGACVTMQNFGFVFPLYLLVMPWLERMTPELYVLLYFLSSIVTVVIFYQIFGWFSKVILKAISRPVFVVRRLTLRGGSQIIDLAPKTERLTVS